MENRAPDSGLELVLDNRKLIVAFALLMVVCGCFFVLGFVEGRRQGAQEATRNEQRDTKIAGEPAKRPVEDRSAKEPLDWYKNVSGREDPTVTPKPVLPLPSRETSAAKPVEPQPSEVARSTSPPDQKPSVSPKMTYSAQVGVFRNRDKAEGEARALKTKGYQSYIESLDSGVYSLRVGKFESRAEAVALSRRLKADGFPALIKSK